MAVQFGRQTMSLKVDVTKMKEESSIEYPKFPYSDY